MKSRYLIAFWVIITPTIAFAGCEKEKELSFFQSLGAAITGTVKNFGNAAGGVAKTVENTAKVGLAEVGEAISDNKYKRPDKVVDFNMEENECN